MKSSFHRKHLFAWIAAVVFGSVSCVMLMAYPPYHANVIVVPWTLATLGLWRLAAILGPYDLFTILAGTIGLALSFGHRYAIGVQCFLPDDGHTFFNVLVDAPRPLDFSMVLRFFSIFFAWSLTTTWCGIALKRWSRTWYSDDAMVPSHPALSKLESFRAGRWLLIDLGLILGVTFTLLYVETVDRIAEGAPQYLIRTLLSTASPVPMRLHAIWELSQFNSDEATQALRDAAEEQPPPVNIVSAATLLERNNISELPLFEDVCLRHPSELGPFQETTGRTFSTSESQSSSIQLESYLGDLSNPEALPALLRLMSSPDTSTRRGAAEALANLQSAAAIDALIKALDDNDQKVRFYSVVGLARITGKPNKYNEWYPGVDLFDQNEQPYLAHWKAWASQRAQAKP